MNNETIKMLAELRKHCVTRWEKLDRQNPNAIIKEDELALELQTVIHSLDDCLRPYVKFVKMS